MLKKILCLLIFLLLTAPYANAEGIIPVMMLFDDNDYSEIREYLISAENSEILIKRYEKGYFGITEYSLDYNPAKAVKRYEKGYFGITEYSLDYNPAKAVKRYEKGPLGITEYSLDYHPAKAVKRYEKGPLGITEYSLDYPPAKAVKRYGITH